MKLLITYKPVHYQRTRGSYAGLAEFDLERGVFDRVLRLPAPAFREGQAFSVPFAQGLAVDGNRALVGLWNTIAVVDLDSFAVVDAISTPQMADVHSIAATPEHIYVVSTATECLLCFDRSDWRLLWRWGPNDPILAGGARGLLPAFRSRYYRMAARKLGLGSLLRVPEYRDGETRHVHKSQSPYYRHHLNNVFVHGSRLLLNTKGWFDSTSSAVIELDPSTKASRFLVSPGGVIGSHDGLVRDGWYYVTEADNNSVARVSLTTGEIERFPVEPAGFFVRGLVQCEETFVIGLTPRRDTSDRPQLGQYQADDLRRIRLLEIPDLYGPDDPLAVHAIVRSPDDRDGGR